MHIIKKQTSHKNQMIDITEEVKELVIKSGVKDGICVVYSPNTTTGVVLFEKIDPNLTRDFLGLLSKRVPEEGIYSHIGKNADAHIKSTLVGTSKSIIIESATLKVGEWQGVFFCEFDGPREEREIYIKVISS